MRKTLRQSLAIFLMLWLPIFSGGALAMVSCPRMMSQDMTQAMSMAASDQTEHCNMQQQDQTENAASGCDQCGQCHVACSPGITTMPRTFLTSATNAENPTPIGLFRSITLPLFDPPPLAS